MIRHNFPDRFLFKSAVIGVPSHTWGERAIRYLRYGTKTGWACEERQNACYFITSIRVRVLSIVTLLYTSCFSGYVICSKLMFLFIGEDMSLSIRDAVDAGCWRVWTAYCQACV